MGVVRGRCRGACGASWAGPVWPSSSSALGALLHAPEVPDPVKDLITGRASLVIVMVFAVILGPIYEELLFRGFLFPLLAKSFGATAGILLSALPFALLHGAQISMGLAADHAGGNRRDWCLDSCATGPAPPLPPRFCTDAST